MNIVIANSDSEFREMIKYETDRAVQITLFDTLVWIPRSQIHIEPDEKITIPNWLYERLEDSTIERRKPKESPAEKAKKATVFKRLDDLERRLDIIEAVLNASSPTGDPMDDPSIPF